MSDQDKITIAKEYFVRMDQGRPDILELFHEDAEIYFPKFGFGFGRQSLFEMVKGFDGVLENIRHVSATCSNFEKAEYPASTFISIPTIRERMKHGLDGVRIVTGDFLKSRFYLSHKLLQQW